MDVIKFKGSNTIYAEDQKEYKNLPAHRTLTGEVTSCWKLSWKERLQVLFTGLIYSTISTANMQLQPQRLSVKFEAEYWNTHALTFRDEAAGSIDSNLDNPTMARNFERYTSITEEEFHSRAGFIAYLRKLNFTARESHVEDK